MRHLVLPTPEDRIRGGLVLALVLALPLLSPPTAAQAQETGDIRGTVTNTDGQPVPAASVVVEGTRLGTLTNPAGEYMIADVPVGTHTVRVSVIGLQPGSRQVTVRANATATADFSLGIDALNMEGIVVTGSPNPKVKLASSVAVTATPEVEIEQRAPLSTADLMEAVPGFYVESSGGQGGNNVWARGIPQDGGFRYVAVYEEGLPVYESPELAFTNIDMLYRLDETVQTMEAVRGGSAAIFASNAPGGMINFVSKTGGPELEGVAKITAGDYGLFRADVNYGGPLAEDWRFNVGGFYRYDEGVRDPGFPANRGGQLKANLTRLLDDGHIRFYGKFLRDQNIFYLPVPLQNPDSPEGIPGFDPNFGTMTSLDAASVKIPTPDGTVLSRDLRDGMQPEVRSIGGELFLEFGDGWTLKESMRAMSADIRFNALFSVSNPVDAATFAEQFLDATPGGVLYEYSYANHPGESFDPNSANGNGLVAQEGWWTVTKPLSNFTNLVQVTKDLENHSLTGGVYFSEYQADESWLFNDVLLEVRDQPRLLDLDIVGLTGGVVNSVTENGFTRYGAFYRNATSSGRVLAFFAQDEFQVSDALRIDGGVRYERARFTGSVEELGEYDLGDPTTMADDAMTWGTGNFRPYSFDFDDVALSIGANYALNQNLAVYGRVSDGFRMPDFEQWTDGSVDQKGEIENVIQYEGGVKASTASLGVFAAAFYSQLTDVPFSDEVSDPLSGDLITLRRFADTRTLGLETEVVWQPVTDIQLNVTATLQQPEYVDMRFDIGNADQFADYDFSGNQVRRVPQVIVSVSPSYTVPGTNDLTVWGRWHYISDRYVDDANNVTLPGFGRTGAGLSFQASERVKVQLVGDNLFNTVGLTEGNPRVGQVVGSEQDFYLARPILGRSARLSVAYTF